jgi:quercetin dioxygenase-like cupin family protein
MRAILRVMKSRREIVQLGIASLALAAMGSSESPGEAGSKTIYRRDLPPVSLDGWQVTVLQLIFPPGFASAKHVHPGFVLGYVLEGELRLHIEGEPETVLPAGEVFYEAPGAIHLPSGSASAINQVRVLAVVFSEKGKELTKLL